LLNEVIPDAEMRFPIDSRRESRALIGISMGGYAALHLAFTHPELFASVGAISPAIDAPTRPFRWSRMGQELRLRKIFGSQGSDQRRQADLFLQSSLAKPERTPFLFLSAGSQESLKDPIVRIFHRLMSRKFATEYSEMAGGHDWEEWNRQIPACWKSVLAHLKPELASVPKTNPAEASASPELH